MKAPRRVPKRRFQKLLTRVGEWFLCIIIIIITIINIDGYHYVWQKAENRTITL